MEYLLALRTFDEIAEGDVFSVRLKKRGIEALIVVDTVLPVLEVQEAAIDLRHFVFREPVEISVRNRLRKAGQSASDKSLSK